MNRMEAAETRRQLKLRFNEAGVYEVYTTIHGSGIYRWLIISDECAEWYKSHFPAIPVETKFKEKQCLHG